MTTLSLLAPCVAIFTLSLSAGCSGADEDARSPHANDARDQGILLPPAPEESDVSTDSDGTEDGSDPDCAGVRFPGGCVVTTRLGEGPNLNNGTFSAMGDDSFLAVGGVSMSNSLASVYRYRWATSSWEQAADLPQPRSGHTSIPLGNGRLIVGGGMSCVKNTFSTDCDRDLLPVIYDGASNSWEEVPAPPMPFELGLVGVSVGEGRALFADSHLGGTSWAIFDDASRTWSLGYRSASFTRLGLLALPGGRVLFYPTDRWTQDEEESLMIVEPVVPQVDKVIMGPVMPNLQEGTAVLLDAERVLFTGGKLNQPTVPVALLELSTMTLRDLPKFETWEWIDWAGHVALGDDFVVGVHDFFGPRDKLPVFDAKAEVWRSVPFESSVGYPPLPAPDGQALLLTGYPDTLWAVSVRRL